MRGEIELFDCPAGRIECLIERMPRSTGVWLILHPHPLHGGRMNLAILYQIRRRIHGLGMSTCSFNFRGVGLSAGSFTGGPGECLDAKIVFDEMVRRFPGQAPSVLGYSFGAVVGLDLTRDKRVDHLVLVGFPLSVEPTVPDRILARRITVLQGEKDEFGTPEDIERRMRSIEPVPRVVSIPASDHFFEHHIFDLLDALESAVTA